MEFSGQWRIRKTPASAGRLTVSAPEDGERIYSCPMHKGVQQPGPGKCPLCGMELQPEGARFAFVRHMLSNPLPILVMAAIMIVLTIAAMLIR